ncbi:MAG TPA: Holliday junction DNA helicase RuvB C-terminal domain-containing protein, partial [Arachnia sp.]|nr:Holliday junction DNA helicase RuvB C-terminal domain-containing protein [Arachnia sp.]
NRLLRRVRDFSQVRGHPDVDRDVARAALELYEVDERGLDRLDRAVLDAMCRLFDGGPVGLSTLALSVGEEIETVAEVAEPFLIRQGFMVRTPRGRVATRAAYTHMGMKIPSANPALFD